MKLEEKKRGDKKKGETKKKTCKRGEVGEEEAERGEEVVGDGCSGCLLLARPLPLLCLTY